MSGLSVTLTTAASEDSSLGGDQHLIECKSIN
jgi:hypothetical protein